MKTITRILLISLFVVLFSACNLPTSSAGPEINPSETSTLSANTPAPTETTPPPTETPNVFKVDPLDPTVVVFDFVDLVCSAAWSTNASHLTCPGHLEEAEGGYIEANDHTVLEGMVSAEAPMLIGLPGNGYPNGLGLFGKYPPFTVYPGDLFKAVIACQGDAVCDLDFIS